MMYRKQVFSEHVRPPRHWRGFARLRRCDFGGDFRTPAVGPLYLARRPKGTLQGAESVGVPSLASNLGQDCAGRTWEARNCNSWFYADNAFLRIAFGNEDT
jgi:hypothetical protein